MALRVVLVAIAAIGVLTLITSPISAHARPYHSGQVSLVIASSAATNLMPQISVSRSSGRLGAGAFPPRAGRLLHLAQTSKPAPPPSSGDHSGHDHAEEKPNADHSEGDGHKHETAKPAETSGDHAGHDHAEEKPSADHSEGDGHKHETAKPAEGSGDHSGHDHAEEKPSAGHSEGDGHKHETAKPAEGSGDHSGHDHAEEKPGAGKADGDGHANEGEDGHTDGVKLTKEQMIEFGVEARPAEGGTLPISIQRPAEVQYDADRLAHVVPRVSGSVSSVSVKEGDQIKAGQVLAVLDSRELADAKANYLAAKERHALAEDNFRREESLQQKRITSEKSLFTARTGFAEARIALRVARQKLAALGVGQKSLKEVTTESEADLTKYTMQAPFNGVVVKRHLVLGEAVPTDREAFVIADVSQIWVDISVYPQDLPKIAIGQPVTIDLENGSDPPIVGKISYLTPNVSEQTRTATARIVLSNKTLRLRPGMFVNASIDVAVSNATVRIPKTAIQNYEDKEVVFVSDGGAFKARPIKIGRQNDKFVEVVSGLAPGEIIVVKGAFVIKSQLSKESFGDGHNH